MKNLYRLLILSCSAVALMAQYPIPGSIGGSGGSSGATSVSGLTDLKVSRTSGTVLGIAAGNSRIGNVVTAYSAATATLSGVSASSTAYIYITSGGVLTVGHNGATTVTCSGCTTATSITAFPSTSIPIATATYTSAAWDVSGVTDLRAITSRDTLAAGSGMSITYDAAGVATITNTGSSSPLAIGYYSPWGLLSDNSSNDTTAFTANQTRWTQFVQPVSMTVNGIGTYASTGIGGSKGLRFAIADSSGTILYTTAVNTTCGSSSDCRAAFSSAITLAAGVYYMGVTTDSTSFLAKQVRAAAVGSPWCGVVDSGVAPKQAGTGTAGSGSAGSVAFGASMGTITSWSCNGGSNTFIGGFINTYVY